MASKLTGDPTSSDLQQQIIELSSDIGTANGLYTRLRQQPTQFLAGDLDEAEMQMLANCEASLVATLVMWLAEGLLKDLASQSTLEPDQQYAAGVSFDIQVVRTLCTAWKEARGST